MTTLSDALKPENVFCNDKEITCKKQLLERIGKIAIATQPDLNYVEVLQALIQREKLGSTALGHGVAVPHARIDMIEEPIVCLITLHNAIKFYDDETVAIDIIFGILAPKNANEKQLSILSDIAKNLQEKPYRDRLRSATSNETLFQAALSLT